MIISFSLFLFIPISLPLTHKHTNHVISELEKVQGEKQRLKKVSTSCKYQRL